MQNKQCCCFDLTLSTNHPGIVEATKMAFLKDNVFFKVTPNTDTFFYVLSCANQWRGHLPLNDKNTTVFLQKKKHGTLSHMITCVFEKCRLLAVEDCVYNSNTPTRAVPRSFVVQKILRNYLVQ